MAYEDKYKEFEQYIRATESEPKERAELWQTAIGLQKVDGLSVSDYLIETAKKHIEGEVSIDDVDALISTYYRSEAAREIPEDMKEADEVSKNIVRVLSEPSFSFSVQGLAGLHRRIFKGIMKHAGDFRQYNITKKEWVLDGGTVLYGPFEDLVPTIEYDLEQERRFRYKGLTQVQIIEHLARFISGIWQIHPFPEGNTRTTAVFLIKYLRSIGIPATNDMFKEHSWYFRNALVRANYHNAIKGIESTTEYLVLFLRNLIIGENNELKNRYLHVRWNDTKPQNDASKPQNEVSEDAKPQNNASKPHLTVKEKSVVDIMTGNPRVSIDEIARMTGISDSTVDRIIKSLKGKGIIERKGAKNNSQWIVKEC
ncbi:MAG: winged helix-turn-helix transcriptional regulator [Bacteroides sp.]|nr:winged helix-turn-helix transcriptional regulator [Bacteroides sp.]